MMLKSIGDRPLEEKEEDEEIGASPVLTTPDVDDYPDGGLATLSIVLGVSLSTISSPFEIYSRGGPRSLPVLSSQRSYVPRASIWKNLRD